MSEGHGGLTAGALAYVRALAEVERTGLAWHMRQGTLEALQAAQAERERVFEALTDEERGTVCVAQAALLRRLERVLADAAQTNHVAPPTGVGDVEGRG